MSQEKQSRTPASIRFLFENSAFLIAGALVALIWANVSSETYHKFINYDMAGLPADLGLVKGEAPHHGESAPAETPAHPSENPAKEHNSGGAASTSAEKPDAANQGEKPEGAESTDHGEKHPHGLLMIQHFVNDVLMALFFAIAGKEVWEALLPGGALSNPRKAAVPLLATAGGVIGPAVLYVIGALLIGRFEEFHRGWAIPCATDIAFSYLVARIIFGNGHAAIAFLLLLAIADDAAGLVILAVFYPNPDQPLNPWWLLLSVAAIVLGFGLRKLRLHSFWWYLVIPGGMSWFAFNQAGIHAALGLVPIIPCLPHAHTDLGIFAREELKRHDTLSEFEHFWKYPVEIILGLFGLVNAGVAFSNVGAGTALVMIGLLVGKPLGITLFTWVSDKILRLQVPGGMNYRDVVTLGTVAGIGFTVALFVSTAAYPVAGRIQDEVKMGALGSFLAALLAFVVARALGVRRHTSPPSTEPLPEETETEMAKAG